MPSCLVRRVNHTPSSEVIQQSDWDVLESLAHYNLWDAGYWLTSPRLVVDSVPLPDWGHRPIWGTDLPPHTFSFSVLIHDLAYPVTATISSTDPTARVQIFADCFLFAFFYTPPTLDLPMLFIYLDDVLSYSMDTTIPDLAFIYFEIDPDQGPGLSLDIITSSITATDSGSLSSVHSFQ
jgi:hypothetical protein